MNIVENISEQGVTKLTVTISPEEIREWIAQWLANGGKARQLEDLDAADWSDARVQKAAKKALFEYGDHLILDDKYPSPIDMPLLATGQNVSLDEQFTFAIDYTALPERELSSYDPPSMRIPLLKTRDEEVTRELEEILKTVPCSQERPAGSKVENGDTVEISMDAKTKDDTTYDALSTSLRQYRLGDDFMPPAFDEALMGLSVGDEAVCSLKIEHRETPDEPPEEEKRYIDVDVNLKLLRILREDVNAIDDEFVRRQFPGIRTVDQLKQAIRNEIEESKAAMVEEDKTRRAVSELVGRIQGGMPDAVYEAYYGMAIKNLEAQLKEQGQTLESYLGDQGINENQFRMSVMMDIRGQLRQAAALDAYARHFGIEANEGDLNDYLNLVLATEGEEAVRMLQEAPYRSGLIESARRWKAQEHAVEHAAIDYYEIG